MNFDELLTFSSNWAPPKIDFRKAEILDSYGDDEFAKLIVNHKVPNDVTLPDFQYYSPSIYSFMNTEDVLFYTYAVFKNYFVNVEFKHIDSFLYTLDRRINEICKITTNDQKLILVKYCNIIFEKHQFNADWFQSQALCAFANIKATEIDEQNWYDKLYHP